MSRRGNIRTRVRAADRRGLERMHHVVSAAYRLGAAGMFDLMLELERALGGEKAAPDLCERYKRLMAELDEK